MSANQQALAGLGGSKIPASDLSVLLVMDMSADAVHLVAYASQDSVGSSEGIYCSHDGGSTWKKGEYNNTPLSTTVYDVATSSDGTKMIAAISGDAPFISTDSGATWSRVSITIGNSGSAQFQKVTCSSDGSVMYAANVDTSDHSIYKSTDSGSTWTNAENRSSSALSITSIDCSNSGSVVMLTMSGSSNSFYSNNGLTNINFGAANSSSKVWTKVAVSGDGTQSIVAAGGNGSSTMKDVVSSATLLSSGADVNDVAISLNGQYYGAATTTSGGEAAGLWLANTSGSTWTQSRSGVHYNICMSSDGQTIVAVQSTGLKLYRTTNFGSSWAAL